MEITGKLIQKLPVQSGTGVNGNWSRADILIETIEQYARKVCISFWGDRAHMLDQFQEGSIVTVSFDLESRESRNTPGSWFTSVRAWKIEPATPAAVTGAPAYGQPQGYVQQPQGYAPQGFAQPQQQMYPPQGYPQQSQGYVQPQQGYVPPQQQTYPPQQQGYAPAPQQGYQAPQQPSSFAQPQPDVNTLPNIPQETFTDEGGADDLPF